MQVDVPARAKWVDRKFTFSKCAAYTLIRPSISICSFFWSRSYRYQSACETKIKIILTVQELPLFLLTDYGRGGGEGGGGVGG